MGACDYSSVFIEFELLQGKCKKR